RMMTIAGAVAFFVGGLMLAASLPDAFLPPDDSWQTQVKLTLAPGSKLDDTLLLAEQARRLIEQNAHVKMVYTAIGGSTSGDDPVEPPGGSAGNVRTAVLTLNMTHRDERPGVTRQHIESQLRKALSVLPGARIRVGLEGSEEYVLVLAGEDGQVLGRHAQQVEREL